jgi:carbon monoxide dehydrogenase subunit G
MAGLRWAHHSSPWSTQSIASAYAVIISHDFVANAPMEPVFDALTTEQVLKGLRGVRVSGRDANGNMKGVLELDVAGTPMRFRGQCTAVEADREAGALTVTLTGTQGRGKQQSRCLAAVRLRSSDGSTTVSMQLDLDVAGQDSRADTYPLREAVLQVVDDLALAVREHLAVAEAVGTQRTTAATAAVDVPQPAAIDAPVEASQPAATPALVAVPQLTANAAAAATATAPTKPPARPRYADPGSPVPGRVVIVTSSPLDGSKLPVGDSATDRVRAAAGARPWLAPLILLGILALLLVLRRRRSHRAD